MFVLKIHSDEPEIVARVLNDILKYEKKFDKIGVFGCCWPDYVDYEYDYVEAVDSLQ